MILSTRTYFFKYLKAGMFLACFCILVLGFPAYAYDTLYDSSSFSETSTDVLLATSRANLEQEDSRPYSIMWSAQSSGQSYSDTTDDSFLYGLNLAAKIRYRLLDQLNFFSQINMNFRSGRVQSRFGNFKPNGVYLGHGYFDWNAFNNDIFHLRAGALRQDNIFVPFFMARRSFPGLGEVIYVNKNNKLKFQVLAQQVIPTSYTFNTDLIEKEDMPSLMSALTSLQYKDQRFDLMLEAGLFSFSNLPSKVASLSRFNGNTIIGTNATSEFVFDFEGWLAGFKAKYKFDSNLAIGFMVDMLENTAAPDTFNQAQVLRAFTSKRLSKDLGVDLVLGNYFIESDAMPGYYTSTKYGNTNRKGQFFELGFEWIPQKFRLSASYAKADLINADPNGAQYDADFIFINLETAYDAFL